MLTDEAIINEMSRFNFTRVEAQVYVALLQNAPLNGSQLAKLVDLPRSTVYNALSNLEKRGAAVLTPGETSVYHAEKPAVLFRRITDQLGESAADLTSALSQLSVNRVPTGFANIEGYENTLTKTREFLLSADKEIYLHTNVELDLFEKELRELHDRGVRVIVFSFHLINEAKLPVEFIYSDKYAGVKMPYKKILLVVDQLRALVVRGYQRADFRGMYSDDVILIDLLSQHIHLDIYLHRLEQKHGVRNIVDDAMLLGSLQEQSFKELLSNS